LWQWSTWVMFCFNNSSVDIQIFQQLIGVSQFSAYVNGLLNPCYSGHNIVISKRLFWVDSSESI